MELKTLVGCVLVVVLGCVSVGQAFKQELWLYDDQENGLYFGENTPDLYRYGSVLAGITKACVYGRWMTFDTPNYDGPSDPWGSETSANLTCVKNFDATAIKSLRHFGANDTETDALSLYPGQRFDDDEIFITQRAYTGISKKIRTLACTGPGAWTLFEGQELDGKSSCWERWEGEEYIRSAFTTMLGISDVGSVYKGCDSKEIQAYREKHFPK